MRPTLWPNFTRASARLTATVVLPTPPLPLAIATRFFTPGMGWRSGIGCGAPGGICGFLSDILPRWGAAVLRPYKEPSNIKPWRRGIFCIFCRSRRDRDRCGQLLRRLGRAWALRPARVLFDTANPSAGAAACARAGGRLPGDAADPIRSLARRRWPRRLVRLQ